MSQDNVIITLLNFRFKNLTNTYTKSESNLQTLDPCLLFLDPFEKKQLGHHSIQMTVDIYGHWFPGEGRNDLDEVFLTKENPTLEVSPSVLKRTQNAHNLDL